MADAPLRVLQFGTGVFLRGYFDWMLEVLHRAGCFDGSVAVCKLTPGGDLSWFERTGGVFTHVLRGVQDGQTVEQSLEVRCIRRWIHPFEDWAGFLRLAQEASLQVVVSNSTEAGIRYQADAPRDQCPPTFPARLTLFLHERYRHFEGDAERGLCVVPFELTPDNGSTLRSLVLRHASEWGLPQQFQEWVEQHCPFVDTLVDRIVPPLTEDERHSLAARLEVEPERLSVSEPYHLLVLRGPRERVERDLPLSSAGLNVVWTERLQDWRDRKVRVLNGAHTAMVGLGMLRGLETVHDCMHDPLVGRAIRAMLHREVVPGLAVDGGDDGDDGDDSEAQRHAYADQILERFENPTLHHRLRDIALNGLAKTQARLFPTMVDVHRRTGEAPPLACLAVACLLRFAAPADAAPAGIQAKAGDLAAGLREEADRHEELSALWQAWSLHRETGEFVRRVLRSTVLWNAAPELDPALSSCIASSLDSVLQQGITATLGSLLDQS